AGGAGAPGAGHPPPPPGGGGPRGGPPPPPPRGPPPQTGGGGAPPQTNGRGGGAQQQGGRPAWPAPPPAKGPRGGARPNPPRSAPGDDHILAQGVRAVGDDEPGVEGGHGAQPVAGWAGPVRAVEAKGPRLQLFKAGTAFGAGIIDAQEPVIPARGGLGRDDDRS